MKNVLFLFLALLSLSLTGCSNEPAVKPEPGTTIKEVFGRGGDSIGRDDPEMAPLFLQLQEELNTGVSSPYCEACRCTRTYTQPATSIDIVATHHYVCSSGRHILVYTSGTTILGAEVEKAGC